jgi:outer membrane protein TolC
LKEYNRLYNRGRADLDQVIRAEETLINSEISLIRQQAEFEQRFGELSYLNGTLISTVLED